MTEPPTPGLGHHANRIGAHAAALATAGVVASGPLSMAVVARVHRQPDWVDAQTFVEHFHPIQSLPFLCGFSLVGGFVAIVTSIHAMSDDRQRARSSCASAFVAIFGALICFNYIVQSSFVPALVRSESAANAPLIAAFSMAHPGSLAWALELWGYGCLGVATWLAAPFFSGSRVADATRWLFVVNGPVSVISALLTVLQPGWELSLAGLVGFAVWNLIALLMAAGAWLTFRARLRGSAPAPVR